jgi:tetratricopeptide (TPR) repeat protein
MLGRSEEALQLFRWAIDHSSEPAAHLYSNTTAALMSLDRLDEAKKQLDHWRQKGAFAPFQREMRYRIAFFENDSAMMEQLAHEIPADDLPWLQLQMELAFLRGDLSKFRSFSEVIVKQHRRAGEMENAADALALRAQLESFLGNHALALSLGRQASKMGTESASQLWRAGEAFGYSGDVTQAETLAGKLDKMFPEDTLQQKVFLQLIRSVIERERGNAGEAVGLLNPAVQFNTTLDALYQRGQAYLAMGEPAKAVADFEKILSHRGWAWWQVYAPLARLGIARAYAMQGDREKSLKAYDDFFTTWKDADPEIPILRQAKAEYKKLTEAAASSAAGERNSAQTISTVLAGPQSFPLRVQCAGVPGFPPATTNADRSRSACDRG